MEFAKSFVKNYVYEISIDSLFENSLKLRKMLLRKKEFQNENI